MDFVQFGIVSCLLLDGKEITLKQNVSYCNRYCTESFCWEKDEEQDS